MEKPDNSICVIFGGTGDLTRRKLMPALFRVFKQDLLSPDFALVGISLEDYSQSSYKELIKNSIIKYSNSESIDKSLLKKFIDKIYYFKLNAKNSETYPEMKQFLGKIDENIQGHKNYLYYLAVKPGLHAPIITNLGRSGLSKEENNDGWKRIIIEKPFGSDLSSARSLNQLLQKHFNENQIYRIDHYLGKETVQNILAFRFANGIFEPLWNRNYIDHVEITGSEKNGVGIRGGYYDQAGALRDMVQNHLLQILATIAMEPPNSFESRQVRNEKVKIFQALCPIDVDNIEKSVIRGQYIASQINGKKVLSYRNEDKVNSQSRTETYVALKAFVDNWRWSGVPFYIRTGKRLPARVNEVVINFKKTPHYLFKRIHPKDVGANKLILRIQPDEGIVIKFGMKQPGEGFNIKTVSMDFHYSDLGSESLPEAYERLLLDAFIGDPTLFARADAVEACWEFITPIINKWKQDPEVGLYGYPAGTWGPQEADNLFENEEQEWRQSCENITDNGNFCEL